MRIALVYDCITPPSVGGAERWLRTLSEDLARDHDITYITRRQWSPGEQPISGVRCVAVSPGGPLTTAAGRRRLLAPFAFATGVLAHLLRHRGDYDVVHCLSYPYLPVLSARLALAGRGGAALLVEWLECLTPGHWRRYAGWIGGTAGVLVQWLCVRATPVAICFSSHTERRLRASGMRATVHTLGGLWEPVTAREATATSSRQPAEETDTAPRAPAEPPFLLFAGRHVPDKRVTAIPAALALARARTPSLRAVIVGDGPLRGAVEREVERLGLGEAVELPGFVSEERLAGLMSAAVCLVAPSRRDGHGMVAAEAAAAGAPIVVVEAQDSALSDLVDEGVNGAVSPSAAPEDLAAAIGRVLEGGPALRASLAEWWGRNRECTSARTSTGRVRAIYAEISAGPGGPR